MPRMMAIDPSVIRGHIDGDPTPGDRADKVRHVMDEYSRGDKAIELLAERGIDVGEPE